MTVDILRKPDDIKVVCEGENNDAEVRTVIEGRKLLVYLKANASLPKYICARWNYRADKPVKIMGDKWERSYGDMEWHSLNGEIFMPWYFLMSDGKETVGCGVMVQPNSFVSFQCDASGITAWFDVRCGGVGVRLNGREILAGTVVCESYSGMSEFQAAREFCKVMSSKPILPKEPVYGSNNWYYAYGKFTKADLTEDAKLISELTKECENRPYMVIDDGWEIGRTGGPWTPKDEFADMAAITKEFKEIGVKPGIWFRPLHDEELEEKHPDWRMHAGAEGRALKYLDPSHPEVKKYLTDLISKIKGWGFELIKHDFSTYDMFGYFGDYLNGKISPSDELYFYDRTKTSAEIVLDFYRLIRKAAGDMVIIGCNTVSHLCAGLVEINRIGDDTSGREWSRTRAYGVNTLAFRLCQNKAFYMVDADCVGILDDNIPWKLNKQWLDLLANSGSPLFVSMKPASLNDEMKRDIAAAMRKNAIQNSSAEPLDWTYNNQPQEWLINNEHRSYDFIMDSYPSLLKAKIQPY